MKKYIICSISFLIFSIYPLFSQVGINTGSPEGPLHVKSQALPQSNKGVLIDNDGNGGISVIIDNTAYPSASVSLGASNKAFMPNSVALASALGNATGNPIKNPVDGMVVYNTARAGEVPDNVIPGLYVFSAAQNRWMYCVTETSNSITYTLGSSLTLPKTTSYNITSNYASLPLTPVGSSTSANYIEVKATAAYALMLTLSGSINPVPTGTSFQGMIVYLAAVLLNDDGTEEILDIAEINPVAFSKITNRETGVTYPVTLGFDAQRGQRIAIRISSYDNGSSVWTLLPDETSIVFFKI